MSGEAAGVALEDDLRGPGEALSDLAGVTGLVLGDSGDHVVVELLHDPEQADPR